MGVGRFSPLFEIPIMIAAVASAIFMVAYPETVFNSALKGLKVWWEIVFPALLPFFIGAQVLMRLGVVNFLGVLLEPAMRPLFNVPGIGAFVLTMGVTSGYPTGAMLTARLRRQGLLTRVEAERLISFASTAGPLFLAGAVAVGMFQNPGLAGLIMASHYLAAVLTGVLLRFYNPSGETTPRDNLKGSLVARAIAALVDAREKNNQPLGRILGDSVKESIQTLLLIGGFIILFSVIIQLLTATRFLEALVQVAAIPMLWIGFDPVTIPGLATGIFEITIGTQAVSQSPAVLLQRVTVASIIISLGGLSVLSQVAAMIQGTDISLKPYVLGRIIQAVFSAAITLSLFNPDSHVPVLAEPSGSGLVAAVPHNSLYDRAIGLASGSPQWVPGLMWSASTLATALGVLLAIGTLTLVLRRVRYLR